MSKLQNRKRIAVLDLALGAAIASSEGQSVQVDGKSVIKLNSAIEYAPRQESGAAAIRQRVRKGELPFVKQLQDTKAGNYYISMEDLDSMITPQS